jgi:outer membrane protein assembly factor BamA
LSDGAVLGSRGGTVSGFGLALRWDTRDGVFYPKRGQFVVTWLDFRSSAFGSDYDYMKWKTDARAYFLLGGNRVLAVQGLLLGAGGGTPFMALPRLGGSEIMRGYNSERFRDRWLAEAQAEVRIPLFWKLGFDVFAGVGRVAGSLAGLKPDGFKFAAGWGLRLKLNAEGACLRLDFGYGRGVSEMYLSAGEAF